MIFNGFSSFYWASSLKLTQNHFQDLKPFSVSSYELVWWVWWSQGPRIVLVRPELYSAFFSRQRNYLYDIMDEIQTAGHVSVPT